MAKNNAHKGESSEDRLKRFQSSTPIEAIGTLLNSIDNHFNNEIRETLSDEKNPQTSLLFLGVHAAALTIGEVFFSGEPKDIYTQFLEQFVDGTTPDTRFSSIASSIHDWRNIIAHQWIGSQGHVIAYDYGMGLGWEEQDGVLIINPKIYSEHYLRAFEAGGKIWNPENMFTEQELESIKQKIIDRYQSR